jgi:hypothetical protein
MGIASFFGGLLDESTSFAFVSGFFSNYLIGSGALVVAG